MNTINIARLASAAMVVCSACSQPGPMSDEELGSAELELGDGTLAGHERNILRYLRIDQSVTSPSDLSALINDGFRYVAQTFTAGRTGQLEGVEIAVTGVTDAPLRVSIRPAEDGIPGTYVYSEGTLPSGSSTIGSIVWLNGAVPQKPGDQLAIVVDYPSAPPPSPDDMQGYWSGASGNTNGDVYLGGAASASLDGVNWNVTPADTLHFRTYLFPQNGSP